MTPNQIIKLQLMAAPQAPLRLKNVFFLMKFFIKGNYRYGFWFGPTDEDGRLTIKYDEVEAKRKASASESLMDYNTPLDECDRRILIKTPSLEELKDAYDIAKRWSGKGVASSEMQSWLTASNGQIRAADAWRELHDGDNPFTIPCLGR